MEVGGYGVPSLAAQLARQAGVILPEQDKILLNYLAASAAVETLSYGATAQALRDEDPVLLEKLRGAVVIIGSSAPGLFDIKTTPIATDTPGVFILAAAVENLLNESWLVELSSLAGLIFLLAMLLLALFFLARDVNYEKLDPVFVAADVIALLIAAYSLLEYQRFADISFASHFALGFYSLSRVCKVIYRGQLSQGRLLINHEEYPDVSIVCGSYCLTGEETKPKLLRRLLLKHNPLIAFSDTIFNKDVGLLAEYAADGGLFYVVVARDDTESALQSINTALKQYQNKGLGSSFICG